MADHNGIGAHAMSGLAIAGAVQRMHQGSARQGHELEQMNALKRKKPDDGWDASEEEQLAVVNGGGTSTGVAKSETNETSIWHLPTHSYVLVLRTRQWIDIYQWIEGGNNLHFTPPYNCWEFYTCTSAGVQDTANPMVLNAARQFHQVVSPGNIPGAILNWKPTFTTHRVRPIKTKWKLSKPMPYTNKPGAAQPEQVSGNDTPYFCVAVDSAGMVPSIWIAGGYNSVSNEIRDKSHYLREQDFPGMPELINNVVTVGKNGSYTHTTEYDCLENYSYTPPQMYLTEETAPYGGAQFGSYQANPIDWTYLPQPLRGNTAVGMVGVQQHLVTTEHYHNVVGHNPYYYNKEARHPFVCAFVPASGGR